jgi:hypothetical protein
VSGLFRNPTLSQPKLSPDGKHIAFAFSNAELQRVFVRSVDGKNSLGLAEFSLEKVRLRGFDWANSGRLILGADAPDPKEQGVQPMVKWAVEQGIPDPERVVIGLRGRVLGADGSAFGGALANVRAGRRPIARRLMIRSESRYAVEWVEPTRH